MGTRRKPHSRASFAASCTCGRSSTPSSTAMKRRSSRSTSQSCTAVSGATPLPTPVARAFEVSGPVSGEGSHEKQKGDEPREQRNAREAWLRVAIEATGIGLWEWRIGSNSSSWDAGMLRIFGRTTAPVDDAEYVSLIHPEDREQARARIRQSLQTGIYEPWEYRILRPDGSVRWVQSLGSVLLGADDKPERLLGGLIDVTERREMQEQRQASQRLEAVGQLAAGVAHNFNNMLAAILPAVELAQEEVGEATRAALQDAEQAAHRAADMVRELLRFARTPERSSAERRPHDLAALCARAVELCRKTFGTHLSVHFDEPAERPWVRVVDGPLVQALVNLLINARDAMEGVQYRGPAIEVSVELVPAAHPSLPHPLSESRHAEGFVAVVVRDQGVGMDESVRARIFEPFFTTKDVGKGTGLGLSTAYATLSSQGGAITCASAPGQGTTMRMILPVEPAPRERLDTSAPRSRPGQRRHRRVLVVDDDAAVARATGRVIASRGDEVQLVLSAADALSALQARPDFDLVVLDCEMPGTTGPHALHQLRKAAPGARVLYYSGTELPEGAARADGFVAKPAQARELFAAMDRVLEDAADPAER